ncbi:hypothetical protein [Vibrio sp. 2-2(8)]|uniref:hypothetical protein n=1 Tax=Vibrio sp. 2-2(8) TaxID=2591014 RepID=UPI001481EC79|nr:hypothetical protein [Vibrio sp. 2-2(8)]NNN47738.1 hypothetical protein [Vibrio sp. 2-2(8)]
MKIFNFGACTSSETKKLKKDIKSINEQIKSVRPQTNETKLENLAKQIDAIKSRVSELDAKHQVKVTKSSGYASMTRDSVSIQKALSGLNDKKEEAKAAQAAQAAQAASKNAEAGLELEKIFAKEPSLREPMQPMINRHGAAYALTTLEYSRKGEVNRDIQKAKNLEDAQSAQNKRQNNQPRRDDWT